jgi:hypothetical protein
VRRVTAPHFQRAINVGDSVRIAVDEDVHGNLLLVGEAADETAARTRGHASHRHEDAVGGLPVVVFHEPLEHTGGLDDEDELRFGLEPELFNTDGNRVRTDSELGAVDTQRFPGVAVFINNNELPRNLAALLLLSLAGCSSTRGSMPNDAATETGPSDDIGCPSSET